MTAAVLNYAVAVLNLITAGMLIYAALQARRTLRIMEAWRESLERRGK